MKEPTTREFVLLAIVILALLDPIARADDPKPYILWQKDIWGPIAPDEQVPADARQLTELVVLSGQNTRAATGFLVSNLSAKPLLARLLLTQPAKDSPLQKGTALLNEDHIQFRQAHYIELHNGHMIPELLIELPDCDLISVPARTTSLIWIEIETSNLPPGKYSRTIDFSPSYSGFSRTSFDLKVEVAPVDLSGPRLKQFVYLLPHTQMWPPIAEDLARHDVNTVYFYPGFQIPGQKPGYPKLDENGNIVSVDFTALDTMIDNMVQAGVPIDRMNVLIELAFEWPWYRTLQYDRKPQLSYGTDPWKNGLANSIKAFRDHLLAKGFTYEQFALHPIDEPFGDPDDPKSEAYIAFETARFVKSVDPKLQTMSNPGRDGKKTKYLADYTKVFDILAPYRPNLTPQLCKTLRDSGCEVWTYDILHKPDTPFSYRNMSWMSARDGFTGVCAFYRYNTGSGDLFNSYDHGPAAKSWEPDWCVAYADWYPNYPSQQQADKIKIIPGRRWEAWYQGTQDYRAVFICRELISKLKAAAKDTSTFEQALEQAIADAVGKPGVAMDASRERLIRTAVRMQNLMDRR